MEIIQVPPSLDSPSDPQISSTSPTSPPCEVNGPQAPPSPSPDSPSRPSSPSSTLNTMSYRTGELDSAHDNHRLPMRPPFVSSSVSAPSARLPRLLPLDPSAYSNQHLPTSALTLSSISLSELAHLIRLQRQTEQRRSHSRVRLHRWLVSAALSARLLHCGQSSYRTLVDYFRNDNKKDFTALHSALHDVSSSCDATRRYALLEPDLGNSKSKSSVTIAETSATFSTFMHEIPSKTRLEILAFISEIRTNPDFLAARITSLSEQELLALTSFRPNPNDSAVLAAGKFSQKKGFLTPTASPVERLLSLHRHDSLSALIHTVFANSSGPDSPEDLRRTDAWATTCARLILENRPGWERFIPRVLDVWAEMRDWPVKDRLELYLMQVLQDGQFLLEKAESVDGRPGSMAEKPSSNKPLEYATEEFFSRSVIMLMALVDGDPFAGGLPEGILEIGHAIISKLRPSKKHCRMTEIFILVHWFFGSFLYQALIFPEAHGIMVGYHIPQLARDRILREIASRTQRQILAIFNNVGSSISVMPEVKKHVDNLFDRIRRPKAHGKPILVPAKAITSPKETVEVQPFLVLSPSDIVTLVKSLFPERKSNQVSGRDLPKSELASAASSISGISIPGLGTLARDGSSILSQSVSSMTSDATSRDQSQDYVEQHDHIDLPIEQREAALVRPVPTEDYGRKLREACSEMSRILGADAISGTCHPCADRWAVLHISKDGKQLLTRMHEDVEEDESHDEDSPDSDSEDESSSYGIPLENDYHQLKDAIVKLLSEYELPKVLSDSTAFSNGQSPRRERRNRTRKAASAVPEDSPAAPLHQSTGQISNMVSNQRLTQSRTRRSSNSGDNDDSSRVSDLVTMLEVAYQQCQSRNEFVDAHIWYRTLDQLKKLSSPSLTRDGYGPLLHYFGRGPRDSLTRCFSAIDEFEAWFVWLKQSQERHESRMEAMMRMFKNLRDKMWYKTAVVTSAGYDEARSIAMALKLMGKKLSPGEVLSKPVPIHRRTFSRPSITAANLLLKAEAQVLDLLAATNDHGGPNKLSDDQVDLTSKWLKEYNIERNFCQCEERIHRFNLEIDRCVNKLVADSVIEGPVLWSSELYGRDRDILDRGRTDAWLIGVGICIPDHDADDDKTRQPLRMSLDFQQPSKDSLRSLPTQGSQKSYASSDWSSGTKAAVLNIMDAQDYFGESSPARGIDSTVTFWSPFQTSSNQDKATPKDTRLMSAISAKSLSQKTPAALADEKRRFLLDLKRTLTGLLLSDLGTLVFNAGSETDGWFSESIVDECIRLKEADDRKRMQKLARKKSKRTLKASREQQRSTPTSQINTGSERTSPIPADEGITAEAHDPKKPYLEFPYQLAYRQLLQRFSTHPNPFAKLEALYNLRTIIEHQLSSPSSKTYTITRPRREEHPTPIDSPKPSTPTTATRSGRGSPNNPSRTRATFSRSPPSTSAVIEALQALFCDRTIRPRTLFRDLQYIAAFVPPETLDKSAHGKAFCDASVAAVSLKDDVVRYMVEIADRIVEEDTDGRSLGPALTSSTSQAGQPSSNTIKDTTVAAAVSTAIATRTDVVATETTTEPTTASAPTSTTTPPPPPQQQQQQPSYTMTDAAHMYYLAAREGNAAAERELAIFYLTQPDITPRAMQPFSKPKDVFKNLDKMMSQRSSVRGGSKGGSEEDSKRSDPLTLCLAHHWMEMSKAGGDELAANYLRDRDDIERIPGA